MFIVMRPFTLAKMCGLSLGSGIYTWPPGTEVRHARLGFVAVLGMALIPLYIIRCQEHKAVDWT